MAEAAEVDNDDRHDARVTSAGAEGYPLIVETRALWSPDSLETLKSIASQCALLAAPF